MGMRPRADVDEAFRLLAEGHPHAEVARRVGISRATVRDWSRAGKQAVLDRPYRRPAGVTAEACPGWCLARAGLDDAAYAYLLGQYLGDGYLSRNGRYYRIRIMCADAYPNIMAECARAIRRVSGKDARFIARQGCTEVYASWAHWLCFLPHGPGRKHTRTIALADWQHEIAVARNPAWLLRGLIHSDGCRVTNRVVVNGKAYEYPRYFLSNKSADIQALFLEACARLGIEARRSNDCNISVARRDAVARLDWFVGPKS
jgi:hypothetical protein